MFVYILVASAVSSMVLSDTAIVVSYYFSTFESLKYAGVSASTCSNLLSVYTPMRCISLPVNEMMILMAYSVLWILIISYNHGKGSRLASSFVVSKLSPILVSCLTCCLIKDPIFSLRAAILATSSAGGRYRWVYL